MKETIEKNLWLKIGIMTYNVGDQKCNPGFEYISS